MSKNIIIAIAVIFSTSLSLQLKAENNKFGVEPETFIKLTDKQSYKNQLELDKRKANLDKLCRAVEQKDSKTALELIEEGVTIDPLFERDRAYVLYKASSAAMVDVLKKIVRGKEDVELAFYAIQNRLEWPSFKKKWDNMVKTFSNSLGYPNTVIKSVCNAAAFKIIHSIEENARKQSEYIQVRVMKVLNIVKGMMKDSLGTIEEYQRINSILQKLILAMEGIGGDYNDFPEMKYGIATFLIGNGGRLSND